MTRGIDDLLADLAEAVDAAAERPAAEARHWLHARQSALTRDEARSTAVLARALIGRLRVQANAELAILATRRADFRWPTLLQARQQGRRRGNGAGRR